MNDEKGAFMIDRTVVIRADLATVFRYFTDSARFAAWWGPGSSIEGRPGGRVEIRYPNGVTAGGEVLEVVPEQRVVFSYGYDDASKPIARGASRVTVTFEAVRAGTRVRLVHEVADAATRDSHVPGWRFQLSLFATVAAAARHTGVAALADHFFALWSETDGAARAATLAKIASDDVGFRDGFATLEGREDLLGHVAAAQMFMPGVTLRREGEPLFCQGTALVHWSARAADGSDRGRGSNVFTLAPDGRIADVVGLRAT